ncbi:MAG: transcriptional regulator [Microbacteriaceae bacterium]|jgi:GAF domain-containing protein|nr:transcriptional regulator [Microbacteriaceae bacterium]HEV7956262.1 GAF and ANTAR domain-containing protein [Marisediminicola sp.]
MMASTRESRLTATFVALADTLVAGYDVVDLLDTLVNACAEILDASAVGLLLVDESGDLSVVASTSERSRIVEIMQLKSDFGGPCVECHATGEVVSVPDIDDVREKWPQFREAALEQGFRSVHAVPLRLRGTIMGALNLFRSQSGFLSPEDAAVAQALADAATIGIIHERALRESNIAQQQLQYALESRVIIEQAKGVIAQMHRVGVDEAFGMLRSYARRNGLHLRDVAEQIVGRTLSLQH